MWEANLKKPMLSPLQSIVYFLLAESIGILDIKYHQCIGCLRQWHLK